MREGFIFGSGVHGRIFLKALVNHQFNVLGFIDDKAIEGELVEGLPTFRPSQVANKSLPVLVSVGLISKSIKSRLLGEGFHDVLDFTECMNQLPALVGPMAKTSMWYSSEPSEMVDIDRLAQVRSMFSDDISKRLLDKIIDFRLNPRTEAYITPDSHTQYFPSDIDVFNGLETVRFIDGGAFTGDTVATLCRVCASKAKKLDYVACFEPDPSNIFSLSQTIKREHFSANNFDAYLYRAGLWSEASLRSFNPSANASSSIAKPVSQESQDLVQCFTLDETVLYAAPNFVKLDIEGAEKEAITGAREIISTLKPVMAIALYHKPSDLWEIPLLVAKINPDYCMHLRVYGDMFLETVLYCLPKSYANINRDFI